MKNIFRPFLILAVFILLPLGIVEGVLAYTKEKCLSRTNFEIFDRKIELFQAQPKYDVVFIGSSEVLWGIDPAAFDSESGLKSFNWGLNGMVSGRNLRLLPYLDNTTDLSKKTKRVLIGINFREDTGTEPTENVDCEGLGELEKPIYLSPFAMESGLSKICKQTWRKNLISPVEKSLVLVRYRGALREALINGKRPQKLETIPLTPLGYHPRLSLSQDLHERDLNDKWFADEKNIMRTKANLNDLIGPNGSYEQLLNYFKHQGIKVTFFINPTNPRQLLFWNHNANYTEDLEKIRTWAQYNGSDVIYLGPLGNYSPEEDFTDRRHLSEKGGKKFSNQLAQEYKKLNF